MNREKLMKMADSLRTGGKGSMRRKKKAIHKPSTITDDKRLQNTLKRIGMNIIPAIEEVNIFKDDVVIQFINPKELQDVLPGIINQLGPDNMEHLRKLAAQFQKEAAGAAAPEDDDDDEVPQLVAGETFEGAAEAQKS